MSPVFGHGSLRLYLLKLLDEQPRHGYDLMQQLEQRLEGLYTPSAGTIYPRLARLHQDGLVEPASGEGGRKTFRLTDAGRAELADRRAELADIEARVVGSARSLAREIRADVRASTRDLRTELTNAVREVRREERRTRQGHRPVPPDPDEVRVDPARAELERWAHELAGRLGALDAGQLQALRAALRRCADEVAGAVGAPR